MFRVKDTIYMLFNMVPVHKLREVIVMRFGHPKATKHPKLEQFENDVATRVRFARRGNPPIEGRLAMEIMVAVSHKMGDVDNYGKAVIDGLQLGQLFQNDNKIDCVLIRRHFVAKGKEHFWVRQAVLEEMPGTSEVMLLSD